MEKNKPNTSNTAAHLKQVLGLPTGILLVAGIMIGSGVFKKIVPMSQTLNNETYILAAWIIAGVITMFGAFTYAGLATMTTQTGGVYEYLRLIYGDFIAFLFGWTIFTIVGSGAVAALSFVFAQSVNTLIPLPDPLYAFKDINISGSVFPFADSGIKILAVITIMLLTWINYRGINKAGVLNNIVTTAKILGILLLIVAGLLYAGHPVANTVAKPPVPPGNGTALLSGLFGAMLSALWAYDGWANITFVTGEIKNPKRNIPLAIIGGVGIAMTLYVMLNYTYMKVLPVSQLALLGNNKIAAAEIAGILMGKTGSVIIAVLIMVCTFGALNGCIISYPRVYFRMAQENVFFKKAANVHQSFRTPHIALFYSAVWSIILVCSGTFDQITNLVIFASYAFFALATWGLVRMKMKGVIKSKVIGYPVIPIIIILFCIALVINTAITQTQASVIGLLLILSGAPFYVYFKKGYNNKRPAV
ncbi:APC family permease [Mucilaginibacter pocheonensis]|uniref:APA family basic amino acid/polyamine antiporter n=1 Tax=Mucilaginibacter pocheonensis TaxID=398050 RepID=A0ABU1T5E1_9SPHI|nr:amino acid permease [Mucilaginibacter pocheonensis]MDR6940519.1 APA family basic amino acid/polyamine antiporter [Mucilaginibacter pocheonensis]